MPLDIRAVPYYSAPDLSVPDNQAEMTALTLYFKNKEAIKAFGDLLDKVLNTWESAPPEWKELSDHIKHGKVLQDYRKPRG